MTEPDPHSVEAANARYKRHVKALEADHWGEYAAVTGEGRITLGTTMLDALDKLGPLAGPDTFLYKVGERATGKWLRLRRV